MDYKKFVPCMYLYRGMIVKNYEDLTPLHMNPAELAKFYGENGADEILIFDMSANDIEHEEALGIIKKIALTAEVPIIGTGNIHRMEDVKKLIYAGCMKVCLNSSSAENRVILEEVSKKFGKSKIVVAFDDLSILVTNKLEFEEFSCELICSNSKNLKEAVEITNMNMLAILPTIALDKIIEIMSISSVSGVSGEIINENVKEIASLKTLCSQNGIAVNSYVSAKNWSEFKLNSEGMVPVITQDYKTGDVLMLAYMNEEAYNNTLKTGKMTYFSRSRNELWIKGDTSGHYQYVKALTADCDMDTILAKVSQVGAACHTGSRSCFFQEIMKKDYDDTNPLKVFEDVYSVIIDRKIHPKEGSYTNYLFDKGIDKILKKLGEEATEIIIASKNPNPDEIKYEISDFLYHMMVLMAEKGVSWEEITKELASR